MAEDKETKAPAEQEQGEKKEFKEITVKMGKGLVGEPFQGKDGKDYRQIKIPNQDQNDKSPWATFVVKANAVHDDQFGKGMWVKLPAEGSTTVRKDQIVGQDEAGKNVYETTKTKVPNTELKGMVEFYKTQGRGDRGDDGQGGTAAPAAPPKDAIEDKPKASLKDKVEKNKEKVAENKKSKTAEKTQEKAPKAKSKSKGQEI